MMKQIELHSNIEDNNICNSHYCSIILKSVVCDIIVTGHIAFIYKSHRLCFYPANMFIFQFLSLPVIILSVMTSTHWICKERHFSWAFGNNWAGFYMMQASFWPTDSVTERTEGRQQQQLLQQHSCNGLLSGTTWVSRYQKCKTNLDLLQQETVSGSGISWAICKSAPRPDR